MDATRAGPREQLLRLIAAAAPGPWLPRAFTEQSGADPRAVDLLLEELWLAGLVEKAPAPVGGGPAVALTERGRKVLEEPALLARFRAGEPVGEGDRWAVLRRALTSRRAPVLTYALVLLNVAVFAAGLYLASRRQPPLTDAYLSGHQAAGVRQVYHDCGSVAADDVLAGQWWRVLTSTFVHSGLLHLGFNMFALYMLGRETEAMWGRARYLVLYLVSAWVGSCVGLVANPVGGVVGASGAVCGLLGAEIVWVAANRRHLPAGLRRRAFNNTFINLVLITLISVAPGISGMGHFGGLAGGAAAAVLLHLHRVGPRPLRWPALAAVALVPLGGYLVLGHAMARNPAWQVLADKHLKEGLLTNALRELRAAYAFYTADVQPLLDRHPTRRDAQAAANVLAPLERYERGLAHVADALELVGRQGDPNIEGARQAARDYAAAFARLCGMARTCLAAGEQSSRAAERELQEQTRQVQQNRAEWLDWLE
jgi:membrane associated rhomboid family serine protease